MKERIDARNALEGYCYSLKNTIEDDEKGANIAEEDVESLQEAIRESLEWLDDNQEAEAEEYKDKQSELEGVATPIIQKAYSESAAPEDDDDDDEDDEDDEDEL